MNNFTFYNPTRIIFGKDRMQELDANIPQDARVLVLYGGGSVVRFGTLDAVKAQLKQRFVAMFGGIEPNPRFETLMKAVDMVKQEKIDFLLAVGGGSVMDGTKFIALASCYDEPAEKLLYGACRKMQKALPLATVVTLPATGSEMNSGGVISYNHGKYVIGNPLLYPQFSVLDPTLTFTLPAHQVANGVIDTFVHVCEQYVTYPVDARFQDRAAEGILQTLVEIGRTTMDEPQNYDARANLMWCATMGLNGLIGSGVPQDWATHMIGHEITALHGIDHGKTLAIILPALWEVMLEQKEAKLAQMAQRVWHISQGTPRQQAQAAIAHTRSFFQSLDVHTRLSDYGIGSADFAAIIDGLQAKGLTKLSETRQITPAVVQKILERAL
jgi:NADP-dependent alcohol dehydrogenase